MDRPPEVRARSPTGLRQGREGLAELFGTPDDELRRPGPEIAQALRRLCAATGTRSASPVVDDPLPGGRR